MPYQTEWKSRGVIWTHTGQLTGNELLQSNLEIYGDHRFDDLAYQIVDLSGVEQISVAENDMRKLAHLDMAAARTNPRIRIAVVASHEAIIQIHEIYQKYAAPSPWILQQFQTREEADSWVKEQLAPGPFHTQAQRT